MLLGEFVAGRTCPSVPVPPGRPRAATVSRECGATRSDNLRGCCWLLIDIEGMDMPVAAGRGLHLQRPHPNAPENACAVGHDDDVVAQLVHHLRGQPPGVAAADVEPVPQIDRP